MSDPNEGNPFEPPETDAQRSRRVGEMIRENVTQAGETAYTEGSRTAWLQMLRRCLKELGYDNSPEAKAAAFAVEREETVQQLRSVCRHFGDNDWPESLHLGDVVDKHLGRHLHDRERQIP